MARRFPRIGIVTGVAEELAAFMPEAPGEAIALGALTGRRVRSGDVVIDLLCAGIGKVAAATAAALLRSISRVELLVVIGTAGKIGPIAGDLFLISEALQADFGAQRSGALVNYTPGSWPIGEAVVTAFAPIDVAGGLGLETARIATSDLFIECGIHAAGVRERLGVDLVDMETGAVAQAAALLGIPWAAVKATTDSADDVSSGAFVANLARAARAAAEAAERLIASLG